MGNDRLLAGLAEALRRGPELLTSEEKRKKAKRARKQRKDRKRRAAKKRQAKRRQEAIQQRREREKREEELHWERRLANSWEWDGTAVNVSSAKVEFSTDEELWPAFLRSLDDRYPFHMSAEDLGCIEQLLDVKFGPIDFEEPAWWDLDNTY
jgi:hypothetical protein